MTCASAPEWFTSLADLWTGQAEDSTAWFRQHFELVISSDQTFHMLHVRYMMRMCIPSIHLSHCHLKMGHESVIDWTIQEKNTVQQAGTSPWRLQHWHVKCFKGQEVPACWITVTSNLVPRPFHRPVLIPSGMQVEMSACAMAIPLP